MEGQDMRAVILTLATGAVPDSHYHTDITDKLHPMVVETRAPRATHLLHACDSVAKCCPELLITFMGRDGGPCRFIVLQGVGEYDNVAVGGS